MIPELKDFIEENIELIDANDFTELYNRCHSDNRGKLTNVLYECCIDPLQYMTTIPTRFAYKTNITNITIPNNVKKISYNAFFRCEGLTSITISDSVTIIGDCAFMGCKNLESVTLGEGVVSIERDAFRDCKKLKKIIIPNGVSVLRYGPFEGCESLIDVTLGTGIRYLGEAIFYGCEELSNIKYKGTMKQFNDIEKDDNWHELRQPLGPGSFMYVKTVQCSDGVIVLK